MERSLQYHAVPEHIIRKPVKIHACHVQPAVFVQMLRTNTLHVPRATSALTTAPMQNPVQLAHIKTIQTEMMSVIVRCAPLDNIVPLLVKLSHVVPVLKDGIVAEVPGKKNH